MDAKGNAGDQSTNDAQPAESEVLKSILPRKLVIGLAVSGFVLSIVILVLVVALGFFWPETLANPTARFLLLVLIALNFAVFFFVFYPQAIAINKFELGVRVTGPLAVFFVVLFCLWKWMPDPFPTSYRLFILHFPNDASVSNIEFEPIDPPAFRDFDIVRNADGIVTGLLIRFPADQDQPIKGTVIVPGTGFKSVPTEFPRGVKELSVELKRR
jgi:hypothetical protein